MAKEFKKLDENYNMLHKKVYVIANATTRLIEDITTFNKDYTKDLKVKTDKDEKLLENIEDFFI